MTQPLFTGSMVAIVTPFKNDKVDELSLRKLIKRQIEAGTSCIIPCGTTGEAAVLTDDEYEKVVLVTIDEVKGRIKVLPGAGSNNTQKAIKQHLFCKKAGADGSLQVTPYYNKPNQEGLFLHFQAIAKSCDLPVVLYNVPSRTGVNMQPETTIRLAKIPEIVGIKEASGDLMQAKKIIQETDSLFSLLSGEDALSYDLYKLGARGVISVTCNVVPKECALIYEQVQKGDWEKVRKLSDELLALHNAMFYETNPIPVKAALSLMGLIEEGYRLPLTKMTEGNKQRLKEVLNQYRVVLLR